MLESPLLGYRPQEGTPNVMVVNVGIPPAEGPLTTPSMRQAAEPLQIGDLVRVTDAVRDDSGFAGSITAAVRAGTVGVVEGHSPRSQLPVVRFTGYFDHPLGLPMVRERADGDKWQHWRKQHGPVQRILPTGELAGPEEGTLLALSAGAQAEEKVSLPSVARNAREVDGELARRVPALEVPLACLERSDGEAWQPVGESAAVRRQAMAPMHAAGLPVLRRRSEARFSGASPLLGWGHGEGFLRPGADTSMVHDAPVIAYDGSGVGRTFNLLYIDEAAECAVVGMGSASGALYSSNLSLRLLPLADVYVPFSRQVPPSCPLRALFGGGMEELLKVMYAPGKGGASAELCFKYKGALLPPGEGAPLWLPHWLSVLVGYGVGSAPSGLVDGESVGRAWQQMLSEVVEWHRQAGDSGALECEIVERGALQLPLDLFCLSVGGRDLHVYLEV